VLAAALAWPTVASAARIAFVSSRDGDRDVYVMDETGAAFERVTDDPDDDHGPTWRPDGDRLAFTRGVGARSDVWATDLSGGNQARLTTSAGADGEPAWSPDGALIAFTTDRGGGSEVYVMAPDGGGVRQVTATGGHAHHPAWSPDGARLAYWRDDTLAVHVVGRDGSGDTPLPGGGADSRPAWSPDGARLAFTRGLEVWTSRLDGSGAEALAAGADPAWAASGRIAFVSQRDGDAEIYAMDGDGSDEDRLTISRGADTEPAWEPGGGAPVQTTAPSRTAARPLRVRLDLRPGLRFSSRRVELRFRVRVDRPAIAAIEVRHRGRRLARVVRRLRRGTTTLRYRRRIADRRRWRGPWRVELARIRPA
jgi:Tol biopolymer transport system component